MGGRGAPKEVTGFEPARSTCSTCGGVGSLGDSKVGCCDFGIDNSLVHGGEGGQIGGSGVSGKSAPWVGLCGSATLGGFGSMIRGGDAEISGWSN